MNLSKMRPSPALIVAFIALFVALSGTGYAVKRASIGANALKKNAVTSSKIRKNAIVTSKIKANNVTGDKILESSVGKVPDADKLDGNDATVFERAGKSTRITTFSLGHGETRLVYSLGPLSLTAKCDINNGGTDFAIVHVATTQDNSSFHGRDFKADLDPTTPEGTRRFAVGESATGTPGLGDDEAIAVAPDGSQFVAHLWAGINILNQPGRCSFGGLIEQVS